jgi:hypothetical protein
MHRWTSTALILAFPPDNLALRDPVKPIKMLKMQIDPAMCMKTKRAHDKMTGVLQKFSDILCKKTEFCRFQSEKKPENARSRTSVSAIRALDVAYAKPDRGEIEEEGIGCWCAFGGAGWVLGVGGWGGSDLPELAPISPIQK